MYTDRKMARVKHKHKSALQTAVSFSHSKCTNKNPNLVTPCYTKIKGKPLLYYLTRDHNQCQFYL